MTQDDLRVIPAEDFSADDDDEMGLPAPVCVLSFNGHDPSGACGLAADIATVSAMGGHCCPVSTCIWVRDTTEVVGHMVLDPELVVAQARMLMRDMDIGCVKLGFLGSPDVVAAVGAVLADMPGVAGVLYLPELLAWDQETQTAYIESVREHLLQRTQVVIGSHAVLNAFLMRPSSAAWHANGSLASPSELAQQLHALGGGKILVTGLQHGTHTAAGTHFIDNVLLGVNAAGQCEHAVREQFECIDMAFMGAGDTLSAGMATLLASGIEVNEAASEALQFLDQSLESGYRLGMGAAIPDRFFWAVPPQDETLEGEDEVMDSSADATDAESLARRTKPKRLH